MEQIDEVFEVEQHDVDAAWEDETSPPETAGDATEQADTGESPSALPAPQTEAEAAPVGNEQATAERAQEEQTADQPESFTLKHLDEIRMVGRDEVVTLAQKGMDYDRIRQERDQLRLHREESDPAINLVKAYAQRNGMEVAAYVDFCRKNELMAQGVNEQTAEAQVSIEKQQAALSQQTAAADTAQKESEVAEQETQRRREAREKDMTSFLSTYPGVKPEAVPPAVWARVANGESLMSAYTMHRNQELEAQIAAERQNKKNEQRTPGSLNAGMEGDKKDEIDRIWYGDD